MNDRISHVAVCAECNCFVEPPLVWVYDTYGRPTPFVVCQECKEAIIEAGEGYTPDAPG